MKYTLIERAKEEFVNNESARKLESEKSNSSSLVPKSLHAQKAKAEATQEWETTQMPLRKGIDLFLNALERDFPAESKEKIYHDLDQLDLFLNEQTQGEKKLDEFTISCKLENLIDGMYGYAKDLLKKGFSQDGSSLFRVLTFLSPQTFDFWLGYGIAQQENGEIHEAITAYKTAKEVYPNNPLLEIYLAESYLSKNEKLFAQESLDHAFNLIRSNQSSQFQNYLREAEEMQSKIRKEK